MPEQSNSALATAKQCHLNSGVASAIQLMEKSMPSFDDDVDYLRFYVFLLQEKLHEFTIENQNYANILRLCIDTYVKLITFEASQDDRKVQIGLLACLADIEDTPMIWVEYREACEQFFTQAKKLDQDYVDVLKHYANGFSYGVLKAFKAKQHGQVFDARKLQKISPVELTMAESAQHADQTVTQLLTYVNAYQQSADYVIVAEEPAIFANHAAKAVITQLYELGFSECSIVRDKRMETATENVDKHYVALFHNASTFASVSVHQPKTSTVMGRWWRSVRPIFHIDLTFTTYFSGDIVLKSLNKTEQSRYDAPRGYLVKCRGDEPLAQYQLHENHVDELERRIDARRLTLSVEDYLHQEAIFADKLLAYKKSHGFMTFSEYHRATHIESRLSYSLIIDTLAEKVYERFEGLMA